ncbi:serralysin C precursor [bacterium BMS3Bbin10]|nr:serralysin C precursor [bacterium BMS3Bbin10]
MAPTYTNQQVIGQIDSGAQWSGNQITYGFLQSSPSWDIGYEGDGFSAFTSNQETATREVIALWDDLIAPTVTEQTSSQQFANIKFGNTTSYINYAHAYYPGNYNWAGEVWLNSQTYSGLYSPDPGDYYFMTILHEVGHALGLSHPGSYNGGSPTYANDAVYAQDTHQWTVMSYFSASNTGADWNGGNGWQYAQTPMVHDILTLQSIYGADTGTRVGDTTYGFNANAGNQLFDFSLNAAPVVTIYDAGGTDTLDLSGFTQRAIIDLEPGAYSSAGGVTSAMTYNIGIANGSWIENAIGGSGDDTVTGNQLDNILQGMAGSDLIEGYGGNDRLYGGAGSDTLNGGDGNDIFFAGLSDGTDFLTGGNGFDILDFSGVGGVVQVNQLAGTVTGSSGNDILLDAFEQVIGTAFGDVLSGSHGINILDGGGGDDLIFGNGGIDLLRGGDGNDTIFVGTADGVDRYQGDNGFDILDFSGVGGVVQVNQLAGTVTGSSGNDILLDVFEEVIGTNFGDVLSGGHGINILRGGGGADQFFGNGGIDLIIGEGGDDTATLGSGDDTYRFSNGDGADTILDFNAGAGSDDNIDLRFHSAATSLVQMQGAGFISQNGANTEIDFGGGDMLTLYNIAMGDLHADDFLF